MVGYPDSVQKNLKAIQSVSRDLPAVVIGESFWREYTCELGCGGCCPYFSLDYLPLEMNKLTNLYPDLTYQMKSAGGYTIFTLDNTPWTDQNGMGRCQYLEKDTGACSIHRLNPLSCQLELIKVWTMRGKGYISKRPFSRGWNMLPMVGDRGAILCGFRPFSELQCLTNDIPVLERLQIWAEYFRIETYLPEVIKKIKEVAYTHEFKRYEFS